MKWISFYQNEQRQVGILKDDKVLPLRQLGYLFEDIGELIKSDKDRFLEIVDAVNKSTFIESVNNVEITSPITIPFQDIICVGLNYVEHCKEANEYHKDNFSLKTDATVFFSKRVNEVSSANADISNHSQLTKRFDYETELAVILGADCTQCTLDNVEDKIFGYTVINDYSARDLQVQHQQWYVGKSLDGSFAMGQYILSKDEIENVQNLIIKTYVNGELRQNSSTAFMIKTVKEIIVELSQSMTLKKGSIIATGTPSGVGMGFSPPRFLKKGDVVISEIEKLGNITNRIV